MLACTAALLVGTTATAPLSDLLVDATADCSIGTGSAALPFCTISEALMVAVDGDVIRIASGTYPEELIVTHDVQLVPMGASGIVAVDGESSRRNLTVEAGATADVSGFVFRNGNGGEGNVVNRGALILRNSSIGSSDTSGCCSRSVILNEPGSQGLTLDHCNVTGNHINGSSAALIRSYSAGGLTIRYSSITNNYVYVGPTIRAGFGPVVIEGCYFQSSWPQADAVIVARDADLILRNTTITGTRTAALRVRGDVGYQLIENSTLTNVGPLVATSILVAGTTVPRVRASALGAGTPSDNSVSVSGAFHSLGYNVIARAGPTSSGFVDGVMGDQVGSISQPLDLMLEAATNNGGPTRSRMPLPGSPVIDDGHPTDFPSNDQNGFPRVAGGSDAGASELPLGQMVVCPAAANSTGSIARMRISGSDDVSRNAIELMVDRVPPGMTGLFLAANAEGFVPFAGGSSGAPPPMNQILRGTVQVGSRATRSSPVDPAHDR